LEQLRELSATIDLSVAPFARLAPLAARCQWPRDWRMAAAARDDVGQRPDLDQLGPFRWEPTAAVDWSLPSADGRTI
jgi:hypothetical protein